MKPKFTCLVAISPAFLLGCTGASTAVVERPSDITLKAALTSTVDAIYAARERSAANRAAGGGAPLGLNVCTVAAVFNIAATGSDTRSMTASLSTPPDLYVSASISGTGSSTSTAARGNQITVAFTSPACNPADTLGTKSPGDVVLLEREIEAARDGDRDPIRRSGPAHPVRLNASSVPARSQGAAGSQAGANAAPATSGAAAGNVPRPDRAQAKPTLGGCSSLDRPATGSGSTLRTPATEC